MIRNGASSFEPLLKAPQAALDRLAEVRMNQKRPSVDDHRQYVLMCGIACDR